MKSTRKPANPPASVERFDQLSEIQGELHLAIGVFDGVHLGHKAVIEMALFGARRSNGVSAVLTFDPHPSRLFHPDDPTRLIMDIETKTRVLHETGVDLVVRKQFDHDFAAIPAESFLAYLKNELPRLAAIYVGENFRFGKKRAGDVKTLIRSGRELGISVFSVDRIRHNGEPISSTRIREALQEGAINTANDLLGYNYRACGTVVEGARLGRTIGFPTLNIPWVPECAPRFGVYYVLFRPEGAEKWQPGVANYGVKPTVKEQGADAPLLEVHALESTNAGSGDWVDVQLLRFLRGEQQFDSLEALKAQITKDREVARKLAEDG
ncbi:MAG: riboflavin biosynthesis protein RibF [Opitutales bacterium]